MSSRPGSIVDAPGQFTLVRALVAIAFVAATIATIRAITTQSLLSPPALFAVVGFSGAFVISTLTGNWTAALSLGLVLFPVSVAIALAPWSVPYVLVGSLVIVFLIVLVRRRAKKATTMQPPWGS